MYLVEHDTLRQAQTHEDLRQTFQEFLNRRKELLLEIKINHTRQRLVKLKTEIHDLETKLKEREEILKELETSIIQKINVVSDLIDTCKSIERKLVLIKELNKELIRRTVKLQSMRYE